MEVTDGQYVGMDPEYAEPTVTVITHERLSSIMSYMESGGYTPGEDGPAPTTTEEFADVLRYHFGIDITTADRINDFFDTLLALYAEYDSGKLVASYVFMRVLGAMAYDYDSSNSSRLWDLTAGARASIYGSSVGPDDDEEDKLEAERVFFTETLNMPESAWRRIHYTIRLQHLLCGNTENENKDTLNEASAIDSNFDVFRNSYVWGMSYPVALNEIAFKAIWDDLAAQYSLMPDFAHFCITSATHLATELGWCSQFNELITVSKPQVVACAGSADAAREDISGWLGDAVLPDNDGSTSFKWDDYWSDIDSVAVCELLASYGNDVRRATCARFRSTSGVIRTACFDRCGSFEDSIGYSRAYQEILWWLAGGDAAVLNQMLTLDSYSDTRCFRLRIAHGDDGGKAYQQEPKELW